MVASAPPHQKLDFIQSYPSERRAAADLLGPDLAELRFTFASVFNSPGERLAGVRIEFVTGDAAPVWDDVLEGGPRTMRDQRGT